MGTPRRARIGMTSTVATPTGVDGERPQVDLGGQE
jgi:hypothetical protein